MKLILIYFQYQKSFEITNNRIQIIQQMIPNPSQTMDQIDRQLVQNEQNIVNMQTFLESKRVQLNELQKYLIQEFQSIQIWKEGKDKVKDFIGKQIRHIFIEIKELFHTVVLNYKNIFNTVMNESVEMFRKKILEKDKLMRQKNIQIQSHILSIQKLKNQLQYNVKNSLCKIPKQSNVNIFKYDLSRDSSHKKLYTNKSLSKSTTFIDYQIYQDKSKDKLESTNKSSNQLKYDKSEKSLKSFKHFCEQYDKINKPSTTKKIMYEVQKTLKQDYQNQKVLCTDHKKYVKQKIQCLKNKNSGIFNDSRNPKVAKRF